MVEIPHIELFHELFEAITPIASTIEPIYAHLYSLQSKPAKNVPSKTSGFYFLVQNSFNPCAPLEIIIDLYKDVTCSLLILSEIENRQSEFTHLLHLKALLLTSFALKKNIMDISALIKTLKEGGDSLPSRNLYKRLFLYTESVRALLEELLPLKSVLLEEVVSFKKITLTNEPLDLKGDLE